MQRPLLLAAILVSVALNASAQLFLRAGAKTIVPQGNLFDIVAVYALRPAILAGLCCYAASLLAWIYVLSRAEASFAYPFLGLGFVIVAFAGWLILGETPSVQRIIATGVIAVGIGLLAWS